MKKNIFIVAIFCFTFSHFMCRDKSYIATYEDELSLQREDSICFANIQNKTWERVWSTNLNYLKDTFRVQFLPNSGIFMHAKYSYTCSAIYHFNESIKTIHIKCNEREKFVYQVTYCDSDSLRVQIYSSTDQKRQKIEECSFVLK